MTETTDSKFEEDIASKDVVLVDFFADWCMPCRMLAPTLKELEAEYGDRVGFFKLDTDAGRIKSTEHRISALPTLLIFKGTKKVETLIGLVKKDAIKAAIEKALA